MKYSQQKLRLENRIVDFKEFEIRPKVTDMDLERYYDQFIEHAPEVEDYFEDRESFYKSVEDASGKKRPKLIAREPNFPFLGYLRKGFGPFEFLNPNRALHDEYFMGAHCIVGIPGKVNPKIMDGEVLLNTRLQEEIAEKFKQFSGYEGIIEIPNDENPGRTKATTFHEGLHYIILRYQAETGRDFSSFVKEDTPENLRSSVEYMINEQVTEILTDKLLTYDSDAQFESRWSHFNLQDEKFKTAVLIPSAIATGVIFAYSIFNAPYLLPLALVPGVARDFAAEKRKQSKRDQLLRPIEYPEFKAKI